MTGYVLSAMLGIWGANLDTAGVRPWIAVLVAQAAADSPAASPKSDGPKDRADESRGGRGFARRGRGFGDHSEDARRGRPDAGDHAGRRAGRASSERRPGPPERAGRRGDGDHGRPMADRPHHGPRPSFGPGSNLAGRGPGPHDRGQFGRGWGGGSERRPSQSRSAIARPSGDSLFDQLDRDGDHSISRGEFNRGMMRLIGFPGRPMSRPERD